MRCVRVLLIAHMILEPFLKRPLEKTNEISSAVALLSLTKLISLLHKLTANISLACHPLSPICSSLPNLLLSPQSAPLSASLTQPIKRQQSSDINIKSL